MATIPSYLDINDGRMEANVQTVRPAVDHAGEDYAKMGAATAELASRIRKQQISSTLLNASTNAQSEIDKRIAALAKEDDWESFSRRADEIVREVSANYRPKMGGLTAMNTWSEHTAELTQRARTQANTLGLRRGTEIARGDLIAAREAALLTIADPTKSQADIDRAYQNAMAQGRVGRENGFIGEDDIAAMQAQLDGARAGRDREINLETRVLTETDKIRAMPGGREAQLGAARALPPEIREKVVTQLLEEHGRDDRVHAEVVRNVTDAAWNQLATGAPIPPELRIEYAKPEYGQLKTQIDSARRTRSMMHRQETALALEDNYRTYRNSAYTNPENFMKDGGLESIRHEVTDEQYGALLELRERKREEWRASTTRPPQSTTIINNMMATAEAMAPGMMGRSLANNRSNKGKREAFQAFVGEELAAFQSANGGRVPTPVEQTAIVTRGMEAARTSGNRRTYELNDAMRETNIAFNYMPSYHRERLRRAFIAEGVAEPTKQAIVERYQREQLAAEAARKAQRGGQ